MNKKHCTLFNKESQHVSDAVICYSQHTFCMKYFKEESTVNYEVYQFGYTLWGIPESANDVAELYSQGYLPYSGSEKLLPVYYLCRSLRVNTSQFALSSENRRVLKKVSEAGIILDVKKLSGYEAFLDESLLHFFLGYFKEHHGDTVMTQERLISILKYSAYVHVTTYSFQGTIIGAVITQEIGDIIHYWFSAYTNKYPDLPLGMWLMISCIKEHADQNSKKYIYLGTGYGSKALYKTNIEQIEYFDGNNWQRDLLLLKGVMKK